MDQLPIYLRLLRTFPRWGVISAAAAVVSVALALVHVKWCELAQAIRFLLSAGLPK